MLLPFLPHVLFELQKNEPKSLKNLSRAQNRTPASSAPASPAGRRADPGEGSTAELVPLAANGGLTRRGRTRPFAQRALLGAIEAELSANKPRSG